MNQLVLQVMFPYACSFIVLVFTVSLYVSAYMAIFKCVGYFIFIYLKDSASLLFFFAFFSRSHTLHVSICVFFPLFSFVSFFLFVSLCVCLSACSFSVVCLYIVLFYEADDEGDKFLRNVKWLWKSRRSIPEDKNSPETLSLAQSGRSVKSTT
jgi:hypothetical protein